MSRSHKAGRSVVRRHITPRAVAARQKPSRTPGKLSTPSASAAAAPAPHGDRSLLPSYVQADTAVEWLTSLAEIADVRAYKSLSYQLLDLAPGQAVLDLGCGRGDDVRALAAMVAPGGAITGVDVNPEMIAAAQQVPYAGSADVTLTFRVADGALLPFADNTFDAVRIDRVLQHVERPELVLNEVKRVLRPGGHLALVEPDWKMMSVYPGSAAGGDDDAVIDAILRWQVAHTRRPLAGRQLGAQLHGAGFEQVMIRPVAYSSSSFLVADLGLELSVAGARAVEDATTDLSSSDLEQWVAAAHRAEAEGLFLACITLFFARGQKPTATT